MITAERLRELLNYEPETGVWTWLPRPVRAHTARPDKAWNTKCAGTVAGFMNQDGYRRIRIYGQEYKASRLAWLFMTGAWPKHWIDHRNLDRGDDRFDNLREATKAQNQHNTGLRADSWLGVKGVCIQKRRGYPPFWRVQIVVDGKCHGRLEEAAAIRAELAHELHGDFARIVS